VLGVSGTGQDVILILKASYSLSATCKGVYKKCKIF